MNEAIGDNKVCMLCGSFGHEFGALGKGVK
jgi:hypothetical protein